MFPELWKLRNSNVEHRCPSSTLIKREPETCEWRSPTTVERAPAASCGASLNHAETASAYRVTPRFILWTCKYLNICISQQMLGQAKAASALHQPPSWGDHKSRALWPKVAANYEADFEVVITIMEHVSSGKQLIEKSDRKRIIPSHTLQQKSLSAERLQKVRQSKGLKP